MRGLLGVVAVLVVIHLDTSFLIGALVPGAPRDRALRKWLRDGETLGISTVAWAEFLCGPVGPDQARLAGRVIAERVPLTEEDAERAECIAALLRASVIAGRADVRRALVEQAIADEEPVPRRIIAVLRAVHAGASKGEAPAVAELQLGALVKECAARLELRLSVPERDADDWSIGWEGACGCELCAALEAFLEDETRRVMEWPIGKERRQHVHRKIDAAGLPVTHETRRVGSPQTLVLTKTKAVFAREREERAWCAEALVWVREVARGG